MAQFCEAKMAARPQFLCLTHGHLVMKFTLRQLQTFIVISIIMIALHDNNVYLWFSAKITYYLKARLPSIAGLMVE